MNHICWWLPNDFYLLFFSLKMERDTKAHSNIVVNVSDESSNGECCSEENCNCDSVIDVSDEDYDSCKVISQSTDPPCKENPPSQIVVVNVSDSDGEQSTKDKIISPIESPQKKTNIIIPGIGDDTPLSSNANSIDFLSDSTIRSSVSHFSTETLCGTKEEVPPSGQIRSLCSQPKTYSLSLTKNENTKDYSQKKAKLKNIDLDNSSGRGDAPFNETVQKCDSTPSIVRQLSKELNSVDMKGEASVLEQSLNYSQNIPKAPASKLSQNYPLTSSLLSMVTDKEPSLSDTFESKSSSLSDELDHLLNDHGESFTLSVIREDPNVDALESDISEADMLDSSSSQDFFGFNGDGNLNNSSEGTQSRCLTKKSHQVESSTSAIVKNSVTEDSFRVETPPSEMTELQMFSLKECAYKQHNPNNQKSSYNNHIDVPLESYMPQASVERTCGASHFINLDNKSVHRGIIDSPKETSSRNSSIVSTTNYNSNSKISRSSDALVTYLERKTLPESPYSNSHTIQNSTSSLVDSVSLDSSVPSSNVLNEASSIQESQSCTPNDLYVDVCKVRDNVKVLEKTAEDRRAPIESSSVSEDAVNENWNLHEERPDGLVEEVGLPSPKEGQAQTHCGADASLGEILEICRQKDIAFETSEQNLSQRLSGEPPTENSCGRSVEVKGDDDLNTCSSDRLPSYCKQVQSSSFEDSSNATGDLATLCDKVPDNNNSITSPPPGELVRHSGLADTEETDGRPSYEEALINVSAATVAVQDAEGKPAVVRGNAECDGVILYCNRAVITKPAKVRPDGYQVPIYVIYV